MVKKAKDVIKEEATKSGLDTDKIELDNGEKVYFLMRVKITELATIVEEFLGLMDGIGFNKSNTLAIRDKCTKFIKENKF